MIGLETAIKAIEKLFGYASREFKIFVFFIMIFIVYSLGTACFILYKDNLNERAKNDIGCEKRLDKQELIFSIQFKMIKDENDSLKSQVMQQQANFAIRVTEMKNEQIALYNKIISIKK